MLKSQVYYRDKKENPCRLGEILSCISHYSTLEGTTLEEARRKSKADDLNYWPVSCSTKRVVLTEKTILNFNSDMSFFGNNTKNMRLCANFRDYKTQTIIPSIPGKLNHVIHVTKHCSSWFSKGDSVSTTCHPSIIHFTFSSYRLFHRMFSCRDIVSAVKRVSVVSGPSRLNWERCPQTLM